MRKVVPSPHAGKSQLRRLEKQHPEWRLDEDKVGDWSAFKGTVLNVSHKALPNLNPIAMASSFDRLAVLRLRKNALVEIEPLRSCTPLVHLDLSSNLIVQLADDTFWACFPELLVLLLHDNKIMDWKAAGSLGAAPRLAYLSLFDNPVSMRNMYRAFTANRCESLRGLDLHAVSDEEVIEGSRFPGGSRFRACSSSIALPQPLFDGITELNFDAIWDDCVEKYHRIPPKTGVEAVTSGDMTSCLRYYEKSVLASVLRRVGLLLKFHAGNSPVIIGQRSVRRFVRDSVCARAAVRIQAYARRWLVEMRATRELTNILKGRGELYLIQEMVTPAQLQTLIRFQRYAARQFRLKLLVACTRAIERFMVRANKRFEVAVSSLDRVKAGGVVVTSDAVGELARAVTKALMAAIGLSWDDAARRAEEMVTTFQTCRLIRIFSYVDVPHWSILGEGITTDGVFVTQSGAGGRRERISCWRDDFRSIDETTTCQIQPISGLREYRTVRQGRRIGIFGNRRVKESRVARRGIAVRHFHRAFVPDERGKGPPFAFGPPQQLWVFRPKETHILARVLFNLRKRQAGKCPTPCILEIHLFRLAAATRIQAAWRGHMSRRDLLETLASCLIVARAGVCIQRWWRNLAGLRARLRLVRRLWALASTVYPTMYMELDVYCTLTRGWQWCAGENGIAFIFEDEERATSVKLWDRIAQDVTEEVEATDLARLNGVHRHRRGLGGSTGSFHVRESPLCLRTLGVPQILASEVDGKSISYEVLPLLTKDVQAKKLVWPVGENIMISSDPVGSSRASCDLDGAKPFTHLSGSYDERMSMTDRNNLFSEPCPVCPGDGTALREAGGLVHLGGRLEGVKIVELTFATTQEAKARALLLALATEETGVKPNRPIAQLMSLEMLYRAAAGKPGQAVPLSRPPATGYRRGDSVEVEMLNRFGRFDGVWLPGTVHGRIGHGTLYKVTLDEGRGEPHVPGNRIRPYDRTGKELAMVEMSHLPSRWQRKARAARSPAEALELELLWKSLPSATAAQSLAPGQEQLSKDKSPRDKIIFSVTPDDGNNPDGAAVFKHDSLLGADGRATSEALRLHHSGSPLRGDDGKFVLRLAPQSTGSTKISAVTAVGGAAEKGWTGKELRPAMAVEKVPPASTWVPGNRFKGGLEKLVHLTALENQEAGKKKELRAKQDAVSKAKSMEHAEPTPRDRLEGLKAAEVALFCRESKEKKYRAVLGKAIGEAERTNKALVVKEQERQGKAQTKWYVEASLAEKLADIKHQEEKVDEERHKTKKKWLREVQITKARVVQRQGNRAKKAVCCAECHAFTSNASRLARYARKHETISRKAKSAGGTRRWVQEQKIRKQEIREKLLRRVEELQDQKRSKADEQRRLLAAQGRARAAMDDAVLRHRLGQATPPADHLAAEAMRVLKPNSRTGSQRSDHRNVNKDFAKELDDISPGKQEDDRCERENKGSGRSGAGFTGSGHQPASLSGIAVECETRGVQIPSGHFDVDVIVGADRGEACPSKPDGLCPSTHSHKNRRFHVKDDGKKVVVFASIPTVTAEAKAGQSPGAEGLRLPRSSQSNRSASSQVPPDCGRILPEVFRVIPADQSQMPWPLGRRWW